MTKAAGSRKKGKKKSASSPDPMMSVSTPEPTLPSNPAPLTEKASEAIKDAVTPEIESSMKRLKAIEQLGAQIQGAKAEIDKQQTAVSKVKSELDDEKETLGTLNRELDELQDELATLARGGFSERLGLKVDCQKAPASASSPSTAGSSPGAASDDSWRSVSIDTLGLTDNDVKVLGEAELSTVGAIADWTKEYALTGIKGVGEKRAARIEGALEKFWAGRASASPDAPTPVENPQTQHADRPNQPEVAPAIGNVVSLLQLGLNQDEARGLTHPHLLNSIKGDEVPELAGFVVYGDGKYVIVPAPFGRPEPYGLVKLAETENTDKAPDHKEMTGYSGGVVKHKGVFFQLEGDVSVLVAN